jgi:hypothetical protein
LYENGDRDDPTISLNGVNGNIIAQSDIKTYSSFIGSGSLTLGQFNSSGVGISGTGNIRAAGSVTIDRSFIGTGRASSWHKGREYALLQQTQTADLRYAPIWSLKTTNGSWDVGHYYSASWHNILQFNYTSDETYGGTTNTTFHAVQFSADGNLKLGGSDINIQDKTIFRYNSTDKCIDVIFT